MSVQDREYMKVPVGDPDVLGVEINAGGTRADQQRHAESVLKFACPTQDANGKWYRCTLAVSNVPVCELFNVISNVNLIGHRLREIANSEATSEHALHEIEPSQLMLLSESLSRIADLLRRRDHGELAGPELIDPTIHIHQGK